MDDITVLIPAYNEEKTIIPVIQRCLHYTSHVIVVNDGSTDRTASLVTTTNASLYSNAENSGKGATLWRGFQIAIERGYSGVITIDADGQHNPDDLIRFFQLISQSPKTVVIGARRIATQHAPKIRLFANKIADFFISCAARKKLSDTQSGFRYYPVSFLMNYISQHSVAPRFAFEAEILVAAVRSGLSVCYVDIESNYPVNARASHYCARKDTWDIVKAVAKLIFLNPIKK